MTKMYQQKGYYLVIKAGRNWFKVPLVAFIAELALKISKSEAKRLLDQGAVKIGIGE